jgi:DNA-binding transcriptional LysR family regulator
MGSSTVPRVRWDDLRVLLAVHRTGSLGGAAKVLAVDTSTASRRLRALEEALGAALFVRTPEGLTPTDLTARLLPHAEQAEAAAIAVEAAAAGETVEAEGTVRLALADAFAVYFVAPALPAFLESNPGVVVDIRMSTALVDLARWEADVAVRFQRPETGDLVAQRIRRPGVYAAFASPAYLADRDPEAPLDWIAWSPSRAHLPEAQLFERMVDAPVRVAGDSLVMMIEAMRAGAGVLLLPNVFGEVVPDLVRLPVPRPLAVDLDVWVVAHRALRRVPRVDAVWRWMVDLLSGPVPRERTPGVP